MGVSESAITATTTRVHVHGPTEDKETCEPNDCRTFANDDALTSQIPINNSPFGYTGRITSRASTFHSQQHAALRLGGLDPTAFFLSRGLSLTPSVGFWNCQRCTLESSLDAAVCAACFQSGRGVLKVREAALVAITTGYYPPTSSFDTLDSHSICDATTDCESDCDSTGFNERTPSPSVQRK
jgi:hypothetical protein